MSDSTGPQCADAVLMVRPAAFRSNPQTAPSNAFQSAMPPAGESLAVAAVSEFDALAGALGDAGVQVLVLPGRERPDVPDQLFPNNWLSLHADGTAVLYPMAAPNRRNERRADVLQALVSGGRQVRRLIDLSGHEAANRFLEGTGSLVLDHRLRVAYACRSPRTDLDVAGELCLRLGYTLHAFDAADEHGVPVYHTNVMLSLGERFAVVCLDAVGDPRQRRALRERLVGGGRELVTLDRTQLRAFAGNLLQLRVADGGALITLSATALAALHPQQRDRLAAHGRLLPVAVPTIEAAGGGSVRCMLAEVFLPRTAAGTVQETASGA